MHDKILVPLDRSALAECVLPHAVALARTLDAQVMLLHVLSSPDTQDRPRPVDPLEWQLRRAEAESYLQTVCVRVREAGIPCEAQVGDGDPAEQIVDFARDHGISLVTIASYGMSGVSNWNVSTVVHKVIARASTSLMIVRAHQAAPADLTALRYERVLAPLDGSARAECILPLAVAMSRDPATELLLTHVVHRPPMPRRTPLSQEDCELADRLVQRNFTEAEEYLDNVRSRLPAPDAIDTRLVISNHVATSLHELVDQERIDLTLLSAHGYSGQMRWPCGSLVSGFISYGTSPLLIVQDAPVDQPALTQTQAAVPTRDIGVA